MIAYRKSAGKRALSRRSGSAEQVVSQDNEAREGINRQAVAAMHYLNLLIRAVCRLRVDLNRAGVQINQPDQQDQGAGVERHLDVAIKLDGRVGDFDDQQNIRRRRLGLGIKIGARLEQRQVGLRLGVFIQSDWVLYTDN